MSYDLTIPQLRYTKAQFEALNPTPELGQLCIETDTETYTVGMGAATYLSIRGNASLSAEERTSADDVRAAAETGVEFVAILNQSGEDDPTMTVVRNTLGVTPSIVRSDVGMYTITGAGMFANAAVLINNQGDDFEASLVKFVRLDDNSGQVVSATSVASGYTDEALSNCAIHIIKR